jgi:hypothetical protein
LSRVAGSGKNDEGLYLIGMIHGKVEGERYAATTADSSETSAIDT